MRRVLFSLTVLLTFVTSAFAQGVQTSTLRGSVTDQQDRPIAGATITATSPTLQGPRTAFTDRLGVYAITALPAGSYEVTIASAGLATASSRTPC
jgi:hypothetical protein